MTCRTLTALSAMALLACSAALANPTKGVTDKEIRVGQTMPYSGPVSPYGVIGRANAAYFDMINAKGGVNGRKINFISLDDAYSPPKTVEQTRRLVEQDEVAVVFGSLGTPTGLAVRKYLNTHKVPQIIMGTGASIFDDPSSFPWTMGWQPNYRDEAAAYARRIMEKQPGQPIALMYAKDDSGKDFADGFKAALGDKINLLVSEATYETSDPTIDSQIVRLKASGAKVFFFHATPKFGAQIIRAINDTGWKPHTYLANTTSSIAGAIEPAGFERAQGLISAAFLKDPNDPQWADDPEMKEWRAWMAKYNPRADTTDYLNVLGYAQAATLVRLLENAGTDVSRDRIMKEAANMNFRVPLLLPGIELHTTPKDYRPMKKLRLIEFRGKRWELLPD